MPETVVKSCFQNGDLGLRLGARPPPSAAAPRPGSRGRPPYRRSRAAAASSVSSVGSWSLTAIQGSFHGAAAPAPPGAA